MFYTCLSDISKTRNGHYSRNGHYRNHKLGSFLELCWNISIIFLGHRSQRLQWPIVITRCPASVVRRPSSVVCRPSSVVRRPSSVVRLSSVRLFTFSTSSPEPLDGFWWNLVWMKYSRSLTSVVVFSQIRPGADPGRGKNRSRGVPFFRKLLLQTGRLQQQTECIAVI